MTRSTIRAEAVTARRAADFIRELHPATAKRVLLAIWEIEVDPDWKPPYRYLAPASSEFSGCIADLTVEEIVIFYRVVDHGAAVEIVDVFPLAEIGPRLDPP